MFNCPEIFDDGQAKGAKKIEAKDELSDEDFKAFQRGELLHHIFQAANRGKVRYADGDDCPADCHVYLIAYSNTRVPDALLEIFPGATKETWKPFIKLNTRVEAAAEYLMRKADSGDYSVRKSIMKEQLAAEGGYGDQSNFNRMVLKHEDLKPYLEKRGYAYEIGKKFVTIEPIGLQS